MKFSLFSKHTPAADPFYGLTDKELKPYFSPTEYLEINPDVDASGADPLQHYLNDGWKEARRFSYRFNPIWYRDRYMHGDKSACPLAHYVAIGLKEKLPVSAAQSNFRDWYRGKSNELRRQLTPLLSALGSDPSHFPLIATELLLRATFAAGPYRRQKSLSAELSDDAVFAHYLVHDFGRDIPPGALFDRDDYLQKAQQAELAPPPAGMTAFQHWVEYGIALDIVPNRLFDSREYLALNLDLTKAGSTVFEHFVLHGQFEHRRFSDDVMIAERNPSKESSGLGSFLEELTEKPEMLDDLAKMRAFRRSDEFSELIQKAYAFDPDIGRSTQMPAYLPPWHDAAYRLFKQAVDRLPEGRFESVVLVPFCKMGGADYVGGILSQSMAELQGPVLVLQTDLPDWSRPDWFAGAAHADLSPVMQNLPPEMKTQVLYEVLHHVKPRQILNVNSRTAFDTFVRFGRQMAQFSGLHAYYFCADRDTSGSDVGYPVWYFSNIFNFLSTAITDSHDLESELARRYAIPAQFKEKLQTLYTPAMLTEDVAPMVRDQVATKAQRDRPRLIWAGRLDRQKRFDILLDTARAMPDVDFLCWGKAVLDAPPDLSQLPKNVILHEPFSSYDDLPLREVDGFFYTSDWDGIPTILIELAARGMPMVASAAGGVPELIGPDRGWTVPVGSPISDYVDAIRALLADPDERIRRTEALQNYVRKVHSVDNYRHSLADILAKGAK